MLIKNKGEWRLLLLKQIALRHPSTDWYSRWITTSLQQSWLWLQVLDLMTRTLTFAAITRRMRWPWITMLLSQVRATPSPITKMYRLILPLMCLRRWSSGMILCARLPNLLCILHLNHCGSSIGWCFLGCNKQGNTVLQRGEALIDPEEKTFAAVFYRCLGLSSSVDWHNGSMRGSWRYKSHCSSHQQSVLSDDTSFCRIRRNLHPFLALRLLTYYFIGNNLIFITLKASDYASFAQTKIHRI